MGSSGVQIGETLLHLLKSRQEAGFDQLFAMYYGPLCFFANHLIRNEPDSEDIVQGVFIKFWEKDHDFTDLQAVRSYLYVSVRNACFNYLESRQVRSKHHEQMGKAAVEDTTVLQTLIHAEVLRQVMHEVDKLPEKCREVIRLTFIEGLTAKEIAERLSVTVSTVNNQKMRGINLLKDRLSGEQLTLLLLAFPDLFHLLK